MQVDVEGWLRGEADKLIQGRIRFLCAGGFACLCGSREINITCPCRRVHDSLSVDKSHADDQCFQSPVAKWIMSQYQYDVIESSRWLH